MGLTQKKIKQYIAGLNHSYVPWEENLAVRGSGIPIHLI